MASPATIVTCFSSNVLSRAQVSLDTRYRRPFGPVPARTEEPSASPSAKTISSEPVQTARGGSAASKSTISDEKPVRAGGRAGARRGAPTVTVTSGFFSGFSPSSPGAVGRGARTGSREGAEIGSPPLEASEELTAAQTRPLRPDAIEVTSVFAESNMVVTLPDRSSFRTSPDPDVPAQTEPSSEA